MKTESKSTAKTGARIYLILVPGSPGSAALTLEGLTQVEPIESELALGRLLRGFEWSAAASGYEPVCVVAAETAPALGPVAEQRGFIRDVASAIGLRVVMVADAEWQAALGLTAAAADGLARGLQSEAQRRFPQVRVTPESAKALLILAWVQARDGCPQPVATAASPDRRNDASPHADRAKPTFEPLTQSLIP